MHHAKIKARRVCAVRHMYQYQTQMLYAGLDNSGRSLLRKLRNEYSRQSYKGEV